MSAKYEITWYPCRKVRTPVILSTPTLFFMLFPQGNSMSITSFVLIHCVLSAGLQVILPEYLQEKFVQSALSYIMCNGEGEYVCHDNQCTCQCADEFPQCNCPTTDLQIMENTLRGMAESWAASYKDFENSGNFPKVIQSCLFANDVRVVKWLFQSESSNMIL